MLTSEGFNKGETHNKVQQAQMSSDAQKQSMIAKASDEMDDKAIAYKSETTSMSTSKNELSLAHALKFSSTQEQSRQSFASETEIMDARDNPVARDTDIVATLLSMSQTKQTKTGTPQSKPMKEFRSAFKISPSSSFTPINKRASCKASFSTLATQTPNNPVGEVATSSQTTQKHDLRLRKRKKTHDSDGEDAGMGTADLEYAEGRDSGSTGHRSKRAKTKPRKYHFTVACVNKNCPFKPMCVDPRSCILDYFGRNKTATNKLQRWPMMCRKCYQRASYRRESWPEDKADLVKKFLLMIEVDEESLNHGHTVLYTLGLRSSEQIRLDEAREMGINAYIERANQAGDNTKAAGYDPFADERPAMDEVVTVQKKGGPVQEVVGIDQRAHSRFKRPQGQSYQKMPIKVLDELMTRWGGEHRTREDVEDCTNWCLEQFESGRIIDLPRFEATPEIWWRDPISVWDEANAEDDEEGDDGVIERATDEGNFDEVEEDRLIPPTPKSAGKSKASRKHSPLRPSSSGGIKKKRSAKAISSSKTPSTMDAHAFASKLRHNNMATGESSSPSLSPSERPASLGRLRKRLRSPESPTFRKSKINFEEARVQDGYDSEETILEQLEE